MTTLNLLHLPVVFFVTLKCEDKVYFQEAHRYMNIPACLELKGKVEVSLAEGHQEILYYKVLNSLHWMNNLL